MSFCSHILPSFPDRTKAIKFGLAKLRYIFSKLKNKTNQLAQQTSNDARSLVPRHGSGEKILPPQTSGESTYFKGKLPCFTEFPPKEEIYKKFFPYNSKEKNAEIHQAIFGV